MFRFTIRDLLWLTLLAAVVVAWWTDRNRLATALDAAHRRTHPSDVIYQIMPTSRPVPIVDFRDRKILEELSVPYNIPPAIDSEDPTNEPSATR